MIKKTNMAKAHHHIRHIRRKKQKDLIDHLIYVAAYLQPFMTLPQVYVIWVKHDTGSSLITWGAYLFFSVIWFLYALKIKDKPLLITYVLWLIFESSVVLGLVLQQLS